jgi:[ribosomal protein S18]-alanine N-acetyltransferase
MGSLIRNMKMGEGSFLEEILYEAIYVPEETAPFPKSIVRTPEFSKYIEDWGRKGDIAVVAETDNRLTGCAWLRLFKKPLTGYGYVNDKTPELSMAVLPGFRNRGIGSKLLEKLIEQAGLYGYEAISLSVDKRNQAQNLYKKYGFMIVKKEETAFTMMKKLNNDDTF